MTTQVKISVPGNQHSGIQVSVVSNGVTESHEIYPGQSGEFNVLDVQGLIVNEIGADAVTGVGVDATVIYPAGDGVGGPADTLIVVPPAEVDDEAAVAEAVGGESWPEVVDNVGTPDAPAPGLGDHEANADAEAAAQKADEEAAEV